MKFVLSISLFFLFVAGTQAQKAANYEIKGTIKGLKNVDVYLAHYFGSTQQVVKDTARVNELGQFTFQGKEDLAKGLYLVSFSGTKYLDLIIGSDHFSFETDTLDVVGKMKVSGSDENAAFYSFQQEMIKQYRSMQAISDQRMAEEKRKQIVAYQKEWMLKNQSLFVLSLLAVAVIFGNITGGCKHLDPGADPLIVRVEQTQTTAKGAFDLVFL